MGLLGIILISVLIALVVLVLGGLITELIAQDTLTRQDEEKVRNVAKIVLLIVTGFVLLASIVIGVSLSDNSCREYIASYEASKYTIEQSLESETLGSLERIELVKQAAELNSDVARMKVWCERWDVVFLDNTICEDFRNLELIDLGGTSK